MWSWIVEPPFEFSDWLRREHSPGCQPGFQSHGGAVSPRARPSDYETDRNRPARPRSRRSRLVVVVYTKSHRGRSCRPLRSTPTERYMPLNSSKLSIVDLFCGAGGLSEGFREAGCTVLGGVDHDPDAIATYAHNFPEGEAICGDIRDPEVRRRTLELAAGCDVVVGGPPCQAFSQVRNHTRIIDDPRNRLYREFVAVVRAVRPSMLVMENVPGLDQMGVREQVEEDLTIDGTYAVLSAKVDAANFGVPQTRERIIFIGVRRDLGIEVPRLLGQEATTTFFLQRDMGGDSVSYEVERTGAFVGRSALADPENLAMVTVEQAIGDLIGLRTGNRKDSLPYTELLPAASAYQRRMRDRGSHQITNVQIPRMRKDTRLRLEAIPEGGNHRDLPEALLARYISGEKWGQHNGTGRLTRKHYYAYRRLHRAMWAWTLNTKADAAYHYEVPRALSVREFARLQSFPDHFTFTTDPRKGPLPGRIDGGAAHSRYRQVGNAVPPLLAWHIAVALQQAAVEQAEREQVTA